MNMSSDQAYSADRTLSGVLRRRLARHVHRREETLRLDRPIVTISFDDAPITACTKGAELLESAGARGTFYIAAGLNQHVLDIHARGHEIACHTYSHLDCGQANEVAMDIDCERNRAAFLKMGLPAPRSFAYPYGDVSSGAKRILGNRFDSLRAIHHGIIEGGSDFNQLPSVGIEGPDGLDLASKWIRKTVQNQGWLILYTHDIESSPSDWGCTPDVLSKTIDLALSSGCEILTTEQAVEKIVVQKIGLLKAA